MASADVGRTHYSVFTCENGSTLGGLAILRVSQQLDYTRLEEVGFTETEVCPQLVFLP